MESKIEKSNKAYDQTISPENATPSTPNIPKKSSSRVESVQTERSDSYIEDNKPLSITKGLLQQECLACEKRQQEKKQLLQDLEVSNRKQQELAKRNKLHLELTKRVQIQKEMLEKKDYEIERMKNDLEVLGEKLVIEIQNREFYQDLHDKQGGELEDLTQTLFEEANVLVAKEARERHGAQERVKLLEKQLAEQVTMAQMEHKQNLSLRVRISALESELDKYKKDDSSNLALSIPQKEETCRPDIDQFLIAHFQELVSEAPKLKPSKLHQLIYMKNALEDDVTPCLRFGGNPLTSTKKFIDAIIANNCFIEEMTEAQVNDLIERDAKSLRNSQTSLEKLETPTTSLFNKTVLERITNAVNTLSTSKPEKGGCSTCGRKEPYKYRFKISDVEQDYWYPICLLCRSRLLSVVDFYQFIRNIKQNLYTDKTLEMLYFEGINIKRRMFYTRIGVEEDEFIKLNPFATTFEYLEGSTPGNLVPSPMKSVTTATPQRLKIE